MRLPDDTINGTINERDVVLMIELMKKTEIKKSELAAKLNLSLRTISRILQNLFSDTINLVEYHSSKKSGGYILTEKGMAFIKSRQNGH